MKDLTLIIPFFRNCEMLRKQIEKWNLYPSNLHVIVVDDGSPEPAKPIIELHASAELRDRLQLYRIMVNIDWNRGEARNAGSLNATTDWLLHADIDHILPWADAHELLNFTPDHKHWYRFPRYRVGKADETRKKDALKPDVEFGAVKPHCDSYLIRKDMYMDVGGYDLAFSGCLGGGSDFLKRLEAVAEPKLLPENIALHVYTRSEVKDASDWSLSRDTNEGKRRARAKQANGKPYEKCAVKSQWERQI